MAAIETTIEKVKRAMLAMQRRPWEQGVAAQALLELGDFEDMVLLAKDSAYLQLDDGRLATPGERHAVTDPAANGEPVLKAAQITGSDYLRNSAQRMADYLLHTAPRTPDGVIYHNTPAPELWIDSMYMAPPFLAVMGCPEEAVRQIDGLKRRLWYPEKKLYSHIWDEGAHRFTRMDFWGVGNGWAAAGMARVIRALPEGMTTERERLIASVKDVIDGCLPHMREHGLFHNVVDRADTFLEVNLSQMLAYTIYTGIRAGWLDESYRPHADLMRAAAHKQVDDYGFVWGVCGAPNFDRGGIATEGQAMFLLMESAHRALETS